MVAVICRTLRRNGNSIVIDYALDQLDFSDTTGSGTYLRNGAGSSLHGIRAGVELGW
jgi:hypothetical protein